MSRKAVIGSLVLALALLAAAYLLLARPDDAPPQGPLLAFSPSQAASIEVRHASAERESVHRLADSADWEVRWAPSGEDAIRAWPAVGSNVRAALRILSTLTAAAAADPGMRPDPARSAEVTVALEDRSERRLLLGTDVLGGRVLAQVMDPSGPARAVWVDAAVADAFAGTGLRAWRDKAAFPGLGRSASRITIRSGGATLSLARVAGRWGLREPLGAPADEKAVNALLDRLAAMQVVDFGDAAAHTPAAGQPPLASITIETDQREAAGDGFVTRTLARNAEFSGVAGLAGDQALVRLRRTATAPGEGGTGAEEAPVYTFTVPLADVTGLSPAPDAYLSRVASPSAAPDVGQVVIRGEKPTREFHRSIDGWDQVAAGASKAPATPSDVAGVEALLRLLCEVRAESASTAVPAGWEPARTVELRSLGGEPLATLRIGLCGERQRILAVETAPVWRSYGAGAAMLMEWLGQAAP